MRMVCGILFLLCFVSTAAAEGLSSNDFAYGYRLKVREGGAVYSVQIPEDVYRQVRRADLGDIRVFNGSGEIVPHSVRPLQEVEAETGDIVDVPIFPLYDTVTAGSDNALLMSVRRNTDGTIIDIDSRRDAAGVATQPSGYLLDLGEKRQDGGELEVFWQADKNHASSSVVLEQSSDLQHWQPLVEKTTLVDLEYEGNRVVQRRVKLPWQPERYLKLSWLDGSPTLTLNRVRGVSEPQFSKRDLQWISLYNGVKVQTDDSVGFEFVSDYRLPVMGARLQFPEQNSIIRASLQSRAENNDSWHEQCGGVFYSMQLNGEQLQSEPCSFNVTTDREWRLIVHDDGAGLTGGGRKVTLDLGWQSEELLFLARGSAPYILAFGSGKLERNASAQEREIMLTALSQQQSDALVQIADLEKRLELGGEDALVPPAQPKPWKTWLLWGVLVAGVGAMALMAMSLFRDLKGQDDGTGAKPKDNAQE